MIHPLFWMGNLINYSFQASAVRAEEMHSPSLGGKRCKPIGFWAPAVRAGEKCTPPLPVKNVVNPLVLGLSNARMGKVQAQVAAESQKTVGYLAAIE